MNPVTQYKRNILKTYRRATPGDISDGKAWYPSAHQLALEVGQGDIKRGAGVIAAYSPMMEWSLNVELARNAIANDTYLGHFTANNLKAQRIGRGEEPTRVLGGNKVLAFYHQILTGGQWEIPVIDRHSIAVGLNRYLNDDERKSWSRGTRWKDMVRAYQESAHTLGIPVAQLQAIVWVTWKRKRRKEGIYGSRKQSVRPAYYQD